MMPPTTVIFGKLGGGSDSSADNFLTLSGSGLRLFPVGWSSEGSKLFVRVREPRGRILTLTPGNNKISSIISLPQVWSKIDINSTKYGDLAFLDQEFSKKILEKFQGDEYIRGSLTLGASANFLAVRASSLSIERLDARVKPLRLPTGWTRNLTVFERADGAYSGGVGYLGANRKNEHNYRAYQRPLVDFGTGRPIGVFGPTGIYLDQRKLTPVSLAIAEVVERDPGTMILDASMHEDVGMAVLRRQDGTRSILRFANGESREKVVCRDQLSFRENGASDWETLSFDVSRLGNRKSKLFGTRFSKSSGQASTLIIYLHGGPGGSLADSLWQFRARDLVSSERELIALEYSGSVGLGSEVSSRLSRKGMEALKEDIGKFTRWVRLQEYKHVFLIDESFGAVPGAIILAYHPEIVSRSFHLAPLLKLQDPSAWTDRGNGLNSVNPTTQIAFERAMFGGEKKRRKFAADLRTLRGALSPDARFNFYFGELDPISQPDSSLTQSRADVMVVPRAGHAIVGATDAVWQDIEKKIRLAETAQ